MKTINAIKKLEEIAPVKKLDCGAYKCRVGEKEDVIFHDQDGQAICIHTMREGEESCSMTDYFPMTWHDNITQAISFARNY